MPVLTSPPTPLETRVIRKVRARLIPFMFLCYSIAYLDRVNVGFASLTMNRDVGLSDATYALGAGLFFWGYALLEVPSNLILARVGARKWIARIMISWGIVSSAMMFTRGPVSFGLLRVALGITEAGFFPGMILYLTYWFPLAERAKAVATFMTATALTGVIGGPLSGLLMSLDGTWGLHGWQWLYLLEGLPAIVIGFVVLGYLTDRPEQATWLTEEERTCLCARLDAERAAIAHTHSLRDALRQPVVALFCAIYFCNNVGFYGVTFWLPQIVRHFSGFGTFMTTVVTALPYLAATIVMVSVAASSDRTGERRWHVAMVSFAGATGLLLAAAAGSDSPRWGLAALCLAASGIWSVMGPFWTLPTAILSSRAAAGGIAFINSVGNLGGFFGPSVIGQIHQRTGSFPTALAVLALAPVLVGTLVLCVPKPRIDKLPE